MKTWPEKILGVLGIGVLGLLVAVESSAQPVRGKRFEFSTSASLLIIKGYGDESTTVVNVPLRLGFFVFKGLEVEPEVVFTIPEESDDSGIQFIGNISYNFNVSEKVMPFVLAGIGYGNALPLLGIAWDVEEDIIPFNLGGGIKALLGDSAAIRLEYRFTKFYEADVGIFKSAGVVRTDHNFFVGISVFF